MRLGVGDLLLLYADGVTESVNEAAAELGYQGFENLARSLPVDQPALIGPALLEELRRFRGASQPFDDLSVIVLQQCDGSRLS